MMLSSFGLTKDTQYGGWQPTRSQLIIEVMQRKGSYENWKEHMRIVRPTTLENEPTKLGWFRASRGAQLRLPPGYILGYGGDVWELLRYDGSVAARFSVQGATKEAIEDAATEDYRATGKSSA